MPPTELYCEGWLPRIILDWYSTHQLNDDPLAFAESARWFSEALLPSPFRPRTRGDPLGESRSHADGVIGHFTIEGTTKAGLALDPEATCFVVLEAKMFSGLSGGVKNARDYNQAARTIACMAEVLRLAKRRAPDVNRLAFYVLAPRRQVENDVFADAIKPSRIDAAIQGRVKAYGGQKDAWYTDWFQLTLERVKIDALAWEDVIAALGKHDRSSGAEIGPFYEMCLKFGA